jgi:hypothetical protein
MGYQANLTAPEHNGLGEFNQVTFAGHSRSENDRTKSDRGEWTMDRFASPLHHKRSVRETFQCACLIFCAEDHFASRQ